eukprot:3263735-Pyramimonas_sp.AAC.1
MQLVQGGLSTSVPPGALRAFKSGVETAPRVPSLGIARKRDTLFRVVSGVLFSSSSSPSLLS